MGNVTSLSKALEASKTGELDRLRKDALRKDIKTHTIDTCLCPDTMQWETGVLPANDCWIIVEQYNNKKEAIKGHKKWIAKLKKTHELELEDVMEYGI